MLDLMRRKKRLKIVLWLVIFSLGLGMLLFFVPGIDVGGVTDSSAATVDGRAISMRDFADAYRRTVDNFSNNGRNKIDPETLKAMGVPRRVLDSLISTKVVEVVAERMGVEVTPMEVRRAIETHPYLQDEGKFIGLERYKTLLAANDITLEQFENDIRRAELARKVRAVITDAIDVSDRELREAFSRENQKTVVDYVVLKSADFTTRVKPSEAELRAYFDGHRDAYKVKEKRRIQYLLATASQFLPQVSVSEQEILAEWNQRPHADTVQAAHILFAISDPAKEAEVKAEAEGVLKRVKAGQEAFAALAMKHSDDAESAKQGGFLGPFQKGQMVKEFEDAAFAMKPGEISELVRSEYGYHIIKVLSHDTPTLESSRVSIVEAIQRKKAHELAKQKAEQAATIALKQKDLGAAAKAAGIAPQIQETGFIQKDGNPFENGISQALQDEAFSLKGTNSIGKAVEHPLGYAVPKLIEVQQPRAGEFAEARDRVMKAFIDSKAKELMQSEAARISREAIKGGGLEKVASGIGVVVKTSQPFNASGSPDPEIANAAAFNQAAFELAPGQVSAPIPLLDDVAVLQVKSRTPFDEAAFKTQKQELRTRLLQANQLPYFEEYIRKVTEQLQKEGDIRVNEKALEQMY